MPKQSISDRYELEVRPVAVAGKTLNLYNVKNWDVFFEKLYQEGDTYIEQFPFWIKIWEASIVLADHMLALGLGKQDEILEIGAGMGVTGLFLGAFGYKVTITDYEADSLELLRKNMRLNRLKTVSIKKLDWNAPDEIGRFDCIFGSEVIYKKTAVEPILKVMEQLIKPQGRVLLAHDLRHMPVAKFMELTEGRFDMQAAGKTLRSENETYKIVVHTLKLKDNG